MRTMRKTMALCVTIVMISSLFLSLGTTPARAATQSELEAKIEALEKEEKAIRGQITNANQSLLSSEEKKKLLDKQVENTREQLALMATQVEQFNQRLNEKNTEISGKEQAIAEQEADLRESYALLKERMRAIDKSGNLSVVQLLLSTEEYTDYLIKSKFMEQVAQNDKNVMDGIEANLQAIQADKNRLETDRQSITGEKEKLEALKTKETGKKKELDILHAQVQREVQSSQSNLQAYLKKLKDTEAEQAKVERQIKDLLAANTGGGKYGGGTMFWPVPTVRNISSPYGPRAGGFHRGIDIANGRIPIYGENIVAAASGVVVYANATNKWGGGYGYYTIVNHGKDANGRQIATLYAHCSKMLARVGDSVVGGVTVLAKAGDTGDVSGPHLHFEVRENGSTVDPIRKGYVKMTA